MHDPHQLLGLQPGATRPQIKRAFRHLAMRWHPDRNADPHAVEHFKALRQAHDALLEALLEGESASGPTRADAAEEEAPPTRGADRVQTLEISFEDAFLGALREVCVRSPQPCSQCDGSGLERFSVSRLCEPCRGSGRLRAENGLARCSACDGRGYSHTRACAGCGGSGEMQVERWLQVQVPPSMADDDELRLAGEGEPHADPAHPPGDLRLRIRLAPHALFQRDGRNLLLQRPVSALRMLIGGSLSIPHPAGPRRVLLEPGLAHPREIRLEAAGFPARGSRPAGDLIVELVPMLPQAPDARLRGLIEQLELELRAEADKHFPELAQWESDWLAE